MKPVAPVRRIKSLGAIVGSWGCRAGISEPEGVREKVRGFWRGCAKVDEECVNVLRYLKILEPS